MYVYSNLLFMRIEIRYVYSQRNVSTYSKSIKYAYSNQLDLGIMCTKEYNFNSEGATFQLHLVASYYNMWSAYLHF